MNSRINQFKKAIQNLREALSSDLKTARDEAGVVKLFELTYELSWKSLKGHMEQKEGILTKSPREALNQGHRIGLLKDEQIWLEIVKARNLSAHVYDEEGMEPLVKKLPQFLLKFEELYEQIKP